MNLWLSARALVKYRAVCFCQTGEDGSKVSMYGLTDGCGFGYMLGLYGNSPNMQMESLNIDKMGILALNVGGRG